MLWARARVSGASRSPALEHGRRWCVIGVLRHELAAEYTRQHRAADGWRSFLRVPNRGLAFGRSLELLLESGNDFLLLRPRGNGNGKACQALLAEMPDVDATPGLAEMSSQGGHVAVPVEVVRIHVGRAQAEQGVLEAAVFDLTAPHRWLADFVRAAGRLVQEQIAWPKAVSLEVALIKVALRLLAWSEGVEQAPVRLSGVEQDADSVMVEVGDPERHALDQLREIVGGLGRSVRDA